MLIGIVWKWHALTGRGAHSASSFGRGYHGGYWVLVPRQQSGWRPPCIAEVQNECTFVSTPL